MRYRDRRPQYVISHQELIMKVSQMTPSCTNMSCSAYTITPIKAIPFAPRPRLNAFDVSIPAVVKKYVGV